MLFLFLVCLHHALKFFMKWRTSEHVCWYQGGQVTPNGEMSVTPSAVVRSSLGEAIAYLAVICNWKKDILFLLNHESGLRSANTQASKLHSSEAYDLESRFVQ